MRIFILDKIKITKFNLPEKAEDSFLIPYIGQDDKSEKLVSIEAVNEKWELKSNGEVNVVSGVNLLEKVILEEYSFVSLKILGQKDNVTLIALPNKEDLYKLSVGVSNSITIGSSKNTNLFYGNQFTAPVHAEMKLVNNEWYIVASADEQFKTYLNGERVITSKLKVGDVIFVNGLRIIWMKEYIKVNNPKQSLNVIGLAAYGEIEGIDNTKYTPVSDEDANADLYKEEDYFSHMPRFVPMIEVKNVQIDSPPSSQIQQEMPFWLTLGTSLTMFASSGVMIYNMVMRLNSGAKLNQLIPQMVMCFSMLVGGVIMPRVMKAYQKRKAKKREKERHVKYKAYLDKKENEIQVALLQQAQVLKENNLSINDCINVIMNKNRRLWSRELVDEDFLRVRLGIGEMDSFVRVSAPQERFTLDEDDLQKMVFEVDKKSKKLANVPITVNLADQSVISFIINCSYRQDYMNSILTQILAFHSALDLKIILFTNKNNESKWEYLKFLPHCFSDDKEKRFFATTQDEAKEIAMYLDEEYKMKQAMASGGDDDLADPSAKFKKYKSSVPYYLIIVDDYKIVKDISLIQSIQNNKVNVGFSLLVISDSMKNLPNKCEKFIQIGEKDGCILEKKLSSQSQVIFTTEYKKDIDMNSLSVKLSNIPLLTKDALMSLPTSLSFLEMYRVAKIEQLNILSRWQNNTPVSSLTTPIGVHSNGEIFKLDLHEKFHGPHGLIAGTTGSGKSEFIITYVLSMCVNYHPYEVQFVLIDYKGGGLAGAFENKETGVKVPHLVGTITNLDTAEMNRTLVSISSELKRRQRKFNEVKDKLEESTMDIYKYQKFYREGLIDEPMAHLFIISDEFAELKSQQPEFLNELVSTARIGRSLGVHLILATQKPSGVVNDQIWSNSKFKVCLKVQSRSDSMEMLKRPEAASIRDAGRFYLQVGYDDYFEIGQSGWGGAKYVPTDRIIKKVDDSINYINNTGTIIKSVNDVVKKETSEDLGEQLTNIVKYIYNLSEKENIVTRKMWLDKIPDYLLINDIKTKYNYKPTPYVISPVIGEYDFPAAQSQGILTLPLNENTLIYGKGGSGKENLISTILWSSCVEHTPEEVNFYVIDCGAETLKMFQKMPHIGEVMNQDEGSKVIDTFNMIADEIARRKEAYSDYAGSYENYCENSGNRDPLIVTIINNYEIFTETFGKLADQIQTLYRDGVKYGVTFIISCIAANAIRGKMIQSFSGRVVLQMPKAEDYRSILSCPKGLIPSESFGRGLIEMNGGFFEFQTANLADVKQMNNVIKEAAKKMNEAYTTRARKTPTVPDIVTLDSFAESEISLNSFPIGYDLVKKMVYGYNISNYRFHSIVSEDIGARFDFVKSFIKQMKKVANVNIRIIDFVSVFTNGFEGLTVYGGNFDNVAAQINNEVANEKNSEANNVYIFVGMGEYETEMTDTGKQIINNLFKNAQAIEKSYFIFIDNYESYKRLMLNDWYKEQVDPTHGIWLGPNVANQMVFQLGKMDPNMKGANFPGLAFGIEKKQICILKHVVELEVEEGEE